MSDLISIIIPCYNQAQYLERAVRSCVEQTHPEVEIIIINDGSTDNTSEVCKSLSHYPNLQYHEQTNAGLANARNAGIKLAKGKYIQFLDTDDYLHPNKLEIQARNLDENPQYAYNYCDLVRVNDDSGNAIDNDSVGVTRKILTGNIFGSLLIGGFFPPVCVLIRKQTLEEFGMFTPQLDGNADYELWLRLAGHNQLCCYLDEKLAYYRMHESNMSKDSAHMNQTFIAAIKKALQDFPEMFAEQFFQLVVFHEGIYSSCIVMQEKVNELFAEQQGHWHEVNSLKARISELDGANTELKAHVDSLLEYTKSLQDELAKKNLILEKFRSKLKPSNG